MTSGIGQGNINPIQPTMSTRIQATDRSATDSIGLTKPAELSQEAKPLKIETAQSNVKLSNASNVKSAEWANKHPMVVGFILGGAIGTCFCPGFGTLIGAAIGAVAGFFLGDSIGNTVMDISDKMSMRQLKNSGMSDADIKTFMSTLERPTATPSSNTSPTLGNNNIIIIDSNISGPPPIDGADIGATLDGALQIGGAVLNVVGQILFGILSACG